MGNPPKMVSRRWRFLNDPIVRLLEDWPDDLEVGDECSMPEKGKAMVRSRDIFWLGDMFFLYRFEEKGFEIYVLEKMFMLEDVAAAQGYALPEWWGAAGDMLDVSNDPRYEFSTLLREGIPLPLHDNA